jgi:hypothetical protein
MNKKVIKVVRAAPESPDQLGSGFMRYSELLQIYPVGEPVFAPIGYFFSFRNMTAALAYFDRPLKTVPSPWQAWEAEAIDVVSPSELHTRCLPYTGDDNAILYWTSIPRQRRRWKNRIPAGTVLSKGLKLIRRIE